MKPIYSFLIKPKKERYDNTKTVGDKELILNTDISDHKFVSRQAIVYETEVISFMFIITYFVVGMMLEVLNAIVKVILKIIYTSANLSKYFFTSVMAYGKRIKDLVL